MMRTRKGKKWKQQQRNEIDCSTEAPSCCIDWCYCSSLVCNFTMAITSFLRSPKVAMFVTSMVALRFFSVNGSILNIKDMINEAIQQNQVVVFSKSYCPHCLRTKQLFDGLNIPAKIFELDKRDDGEDIQHALLEMTRQRTVPNVFVGGKHLGGNHDTHAAHQNGELARLLNRELQFVETRIPELRMIAPNTFFHVSEIHDEYKTEACVHFVFGDGCDTIHEVEAKGVSPEEWDTIFKEKVAIGLTLPRGEITCNRQRDLPLDVVEAYKYVAHEDDNF